MSNSSNQTKKIQAWLGVNKRRAKANAKKFKIRLLSFLAGAILFLVVAGSLGAAATITYFAKDLPSPDRLTTRTVSQSTKIFSRDGTLLYELFGDQRRTLVSIDDIPGSLKDATLAVEDAEFYTHQGFAWRGWLRSLFSIATGQGLKGGSTITQQLAKNVLLSPERTLTRKIKELILSLEIERRYSKDQILQMYLNEAPYGGQAWGVGAASEMYFGKHVRDVNLAEAAFLAGLPQSPTRYSPFGSSPKAAKERQSYVLYLMETKGWIGEDGQRHKLQSSEAQKDRQEYDNISFIPPGQEIKAPHFVMYVKEQLEEQFGEKLVEQGGLRVWTTLDMHLQDIAQSEVDKQMDKLEKGNANATNAGLVSVDPRTGEILAMVGSRDYNDLEHDGNVNVILSARQPGSSIKPIMYVTAFKQGYTAATYLSDIRTCWPDPSAPDGQFCPVEWDGKYWGPMLLRRALSNSRNIPAVKMLQMAGVQNVVDEAHQLGITTLNEPERYGLSLTLGGGEVKPIDMAQAFSVFATLGIRHDLKSILRVEDSSGKILQEYKADQGRRVLEEKYAYLLTDILSDSATRAETFGGSFEFGRKVAVKTGTTNDNRDAWTVGYTPQLTTVVWVGNFNNEPMKGIMGSTGATPIWRGFMTQALEGKEKLTWEQLKDQFLEVAVDAFSGKIPQADKNYPTKTELFIKGTEPTQIDDFHVQVAICPSQGKLATDHHKLIGDYQEKDYLILKEINPDWQSFTDEWMSQHQDEGYGQPPQEKCEITNQDGVPIEEPLVKLVNAQNQELTEGMVIVDPFYTVSAVVYSNKTITKVEFYLDDELVDKLTSIPYNYEYGLASLDKDKEYKIKVKTYDSEGNVGGAEIKIKLKKEGGEGE